MTGRTHNHGKSGGCRTTDLQWTRRGGWLRRASLGLVALLLGGWAFGAGTLQPVDAGHQPIQIRDHHLEVTINNGFAITQVTQTFFNPNDQDLEALYSFPLPTSASLSAVTILIGEKEIHGEVLEKVKARQAYEAERDKNNEAGLATKEGYQRFEFSVSPVRANDTAVIHFMYYQPLEIDSGVGRYLYPLEEGGTDDPAAASFWTGNDKVEQGMVVDVELKSAWPVADVRLPGYEAAGGITKQDEGHYKVHLELSDAILNRDLVFYYRLVDNLPGRIEVIPYRADAKGPGTFMMVVTPGLDLKPLDGGADYIFILDSSGSMSGKIHTLAAGVSKALGELRATDRFRVVGFSSNAYDVVGGWTPATAENVAAAISKVQALSATGSTDLHAGLKLGLRKLDDDRATSIILVTDGVTNTGVVNPKAFHDLLSQYDVRVFGFLMGNSANWPLMRVICDASGGFYAGVSNSDDIIGQIMLAKSKVTHECLHDATLSIRGVKIHDTTDEAIGKVYRGQQLVVLGRYDQAGEATVELKARLTGEDKTYTTTFTFPEIATENPELERLWALNQIEQAERQRDAGLMPASECTDAVRDLGVAYQLVTEETSMVVLSDAAFAEHGIERRNQERVKRERQAQAVRQTQPVRNYRVDRDRPAFSLPTPSIGGGGAINPLAALTMITAAACALAATLRGR